MIFVQALWAALTSRLAGYIGTVSAIALAVTLGVTVVKADVTEAALRGQVASAVAARNTDLLSLANCHTSLDSANSALSAQTASVTALQAESAARSAAASQAVQQARVATAALSKQEAAIAAIKPTADQCASTASILMGTDQ